MSCVSPISANNGLQEKNQLNVRAMLRTAVLFDPDNPSAVSLDLVQWATKPSLWSELPAGVQKKLLEQDSAYFAMLLKKNPNIELVLAISRGVVDELQCRHGAQIVHEETCGSFRLFRGEVLGKQLIGWNYSLAYKSMPAEVRQRVGELATGRAG